MILIVCVVSLSLVRAFSSVQSNCYLFYVSLTFTSVVPIIKTSKTERRTAEHTKICMSLHVASVPFEFEWNLLNKKMNEKCSVTLLSLRLPPDAKRGALDKPAAIYRNATSHFLTSEGVQKIKQEKSQKKKDAKDMALWSHLIACVRTPAFSFGHIRQHGRM